MNVKNEFIGKVYKGVHKCTKRKLLKRRPLIETNPYLIDPVWRNKMISDNVRTSSAIEGIIYEGN